MSELKPGTVPKSKESLTPSNRGQSPDREQSPHWSSASERGSLFLIRFMAWMSLNLGRLFTRVLLRIIAAYFLVFGGASRRAIKGYLRRCLGHEPSITDQYAVYFSFASTLHDRIYFLKDRFELFDLSVEGEDLCVAGGTLLMGAHLGSFEAMRSCGRGLARRRVAMAMFEDNARQTNGVLAAVDAGALANIIPLGRVDSMLLLHEELEQGAFVGVLADRTLGGEATICLPFLGEEAAFPTGPMRMAAALRLRVLFMTALYRGANRYEMHFEPLADFTNLDGVTRSERDSRVREAVASYVRRVEHYCRVAPYNWFNFHDFWANQGSGIRDQGSGTRDQGSGTRDRGSGIRNQESGA